MTEREITRLRVINHTIDGILTIRDGSSTLVTPSKHLKALRGLNFFVKFSYIDCCMCCMVMV